MDILPARQRVGYKTPALVTQLASSLKRTLSSVPHSHGICYHPSGNTLASVKGISTAEPLALRAPGLALITQRQEGASF